LHGLGGGGELTYEKHIGIFNAMVSHGYIVIAPKSCNTGCGISGFDNYWEEQVKIIDWTQTTAMRNDPIIGKIDHAPGYGIAGHSMGGQGTARTSRFAKIHNIRAAVLLHPYSEVFENIGDEIQCPLAGFTGTEDDCCGEGPTRRYYDDATVPKTLANMRGIDHFEPNASPTSQWDAYIPAFFKVWIEGDRGDYYSLIYNERDPDGLCQYYNYAVCEHDNL